MTRRNFLRASALMGLCMATRPHLMAAVSSQTDDIQFFKGEDVFTRIMQKAAAENWRKLPIGEVIGKVAMESKGTPYVGFTLEVSQDSEPCVVNFNGLDCVTFFEDSLDMARIIKKGKSSPKDLVKEVTLTRYRGGRKNGFTSRLHYTTDWFVDNEKKGVIKILAPELPGAEPFTQKVGIMSQKPDNYRQLAAHPELLPEIRATEDLINSRSLKYLPMSKLAEDEHLLQTGDIVGVCTSEKGIDIAHTGLCIKDEQGVVHFMDASSSRRNMKVTLETDIAKCLNWSSKLTGVMFARPLEVG